MAGILKVDQVQSDSNLAINIAGSNVAFFSANTLQMGGTNIISGNKIQTSAMDTGSVVQVVRLNYPTKTYTTSSSVWTDIGTASITPKSASNKILIMANYNLGGGGSLKIKRNGSDIMVPSSTYAWWDYSSMNYSSTWQNAWDSNSTRRSATIMYYDSPATTSSTSYTVSMIAYQANGNPGVGVNELYENVNFSGFTLMEISA